MEHYERLGVQNNYSLPPLTGFHSSPVAHILARLGLSEADTLSNASVEQLTAMLKDYQWERRASAATMLGKLGIDAVTEPLIVALRDEHEEVRAAAVRAIGHTGKSASASELLRTLEDQSPLVREAAATTLGKLGIDSALEPLIVALHDEYEEVRAAAVHALGYAGKNVPISELLHALEDQSFLVREAAAMVLEELGDFDGRVPLVLAYIQDEEVLVREAIAHALLMLERGPFQQIIHLLMREEVPSVQHAAGDAVKDLINLGLDVHEELASIAPLVVALHSTDKNVQKVVVCYLLGRALDALDEQMPMEPMIEAFYENRQDHKTLEEIWRGLGLLTKRMVRERKTTRLLIAAAHDPELVVQAAMKEAVTWLIELALTLINERSSTDRLQAVLQDWKSPAYEVTVRNLVKLALEALEEREPIEPLLLQLSEPQPSKRAEVGEKLCKRARKALMGRLPGGGFDRSPD